MPEAILSRRGYVLAETRDFYGIWEPVAEGEPLERFPLTLEGFEAAEERLRELVRLKRQERGFTAALLWRIVVVRGLPIDRGWTRGVRSPRVLVFATVRF